jgi:hypothetical protein
VRVKWPAGVGSLQAALRRAKEAPIPEVAHRYKMPAKRLLVALCRELQHERGERPFFLACRDAADALGLKGAVPHVTAWRWLREFCTVGILQQTQSGSQAGGRANEYRYVPAI